jgi:hypothetical protein
MTEVEIEQMAMQEGFKENPQAYKAGWIACMKVNFHSQIVSNYMQVDHRELCQRFNKLIGILDDHLAPAAADELQELIIRI